MNEYAHMETAKPLKLIATFSIPAIFAMVFESLAIVIDMAFIGHIPRHGTPALSAMGLMNPIFLFLGALQILTAVSASILVAKYWGQQQKDEVYTVIDQSIYLTFFINVAVIFLIFTLRIPLLKYLGASGQVLFLADQYLSIYIFSQIFGALGFLFISIVRASGYPQIEIVVVVLATISNLLLDALFIVGFQWGIRGAAWATLLADGFYLLLSLRYILQKKLVRLPLINVNPVGHRDLSLRLLQIGFVPFIMQVLISISNLLTNRMLLIYGSALSVAIMAVILNIFLTLIMPLFGLGQGIQPLFAYFYGAKQNQKILIILRMSLILSVLYGLLIYLTVFFLGQQVAGIFSVDRSLTALIHDGLKIYFLSFPVLGIYFVINAFYQSTGQEKIALLLNMMRQVILFIPLLLLLPLLVVHLNQALFHPVTVIFMVQPLVDFIMLILGIVLWKRYYGMKILSAWSGAKKSGLRPKGAK